VLCEVKKREDKTRENCPMRILPFDYAIRNLGRSPLRLAMSVVGSMLVVMLMIAATAFVRGMEKSLADSGSDRNVILLGAGSEESIERSEIKASVPTQAAASLRGVRSTLGQTFISSEIHMALTVGTTRDEQSKAQVVVRGVDLPAFLVHPQVRITQGRSMNPGANEIIVGKLAATRLGMDDAQLALGKTIWFDDIQWTIVGRFTAPNTVMDAEIWVPLNDLKVSAKRDTISCAVLTLDDDGEFEDVAAFVASRVDLELVAVRESEYYAKLVAFYRPVRVMIWVTVALIALGGILGGLNTMYAAFAARVREVGMLQSLGFARRAIILSFMQEAALASMAGALIAAAASLVLLDGVAIRFSMGAFGLQLDAIALAIGLLTGMTLGVIGALPPAVRCLRLPITEALKAA